MPNTPFHAFEFASRARKWAQKKYRHDASGDGRVMQEQA